MHDISRTRYWWHSDWLIATFALIVIGQIIWISVVHKKIVLSQNHPGKSVLELFFGMSKYFLLKINNFIIKMLFGNQ